MTIPVFAIVSLIFAAAVIVAGALYTTWNVIWIAAALALGCFLALSLLVVAAIAASALFVRLDREQTCRSPFYGWLLNRFLDVGFFFARVHIHSSGAGQLPQDTRYLLVCNHFYSLDPILLLYMLKKQKLGFVAKQELYRIPVLAQVMHKIGCLPIDRDNDRAAVKTILKSADYLKSGRQNMAIFPEGYTCHNDELREFRNGAFKIAQRANCPIAVAVLQGSRTVQTRMFRRRSDVYLQIVDVLPAASIQGVSTRDVGQRVHDLMAQALRTPPAAQA